jgi:hypothetical protein
MRTSTRRIATGFAGGALMVALAACGGGGSQGQSGSTASSGSAATKQTAPPVTALPQTGGVPDKPVCEVISKEVIEQAIGKKVHSTSDVDLLAGEQPALCYYYTDTQEVDGVKIQWATPEDALWNDYYGNLGTSTGGDTVRTRVSGLGDGAYKEVSEIDGVKALGYSVLLKNPGIVLTVTDTSGLPDVTVLGATKAAIQAVDKL